MAVAVFLVISLAALADDLLTKHLAFNWLLEDAALQARLADVRAIHGDSLTPEQALGVFSRQVLPGVRFSLSTNPGVAFSLPMKGVVLIAANVLTAALVFYFFASSPACAKWIHVALGLILGGATGNLYDRLVGQVVVPGFEPIRNEVRDFIDCSQLHYPWVFNVADAWLVVGVVILAACWLVTWRRESSKKHTGKA